MRRFPLLGILMLLPAVALVFLVGCPQPQGTKDKDKGKGGGEVAADSKGGSKDKGKGAAVEITADTDGTIKGVVKYDGEAPKAKVDPQIAGHKDKDFCSKGTGFNIVEQLWLIKDGHVANVVVSLVPPAGKKFKITDALKKPFETPVMVDQPFCAYVPHVSAVYADIQPFFVKSSADVLHNVKIAGIKNPATDDNLLKGKETPHRKYEKESSPINISCSVHGFMTAKLWTFDHPYFAVTKEDGSFEIKNAPVGEELTVYVWHESMGTQAVEAQKVTLKKGDNTVDLKVK